MHLRKSEIKELNEKINGLYKKENLLDKKDNIEKRDNLLLVNGKRLFFFKDETPIPTLHFILENGDFLKKITVDKGAVKFVCNGADIMRPGIKNIDENIQKDEFVSIIEEILYFLIFYRILLLKISSKNLYRRGIFLVLTNLPFSLNVQTFLKQK